MSAAGSGCVLGRICRAILAGSTSFEVRQRLVGRWSALACSLGCEHGQPCPRQCRVRARDRVRLERTLMTTDPFGAADGGYIPDPDRDTTALIDGFFGHIAATLREHSLPGDLLAAMRARHEELETS